MVILETDRLVIRRFREDDWKDLFEYLSQEAVVQYEPYGVFSEEDCRKEAVSRSQNEAFWAVCRKNDHKLIGNLYFKQQEPLPFLTWELGYVFNTAYWGQGYAHEACNRMLKHAFEQMGAHRVMARCNPDNTSSWRLMERLSMRRGGHFRKPAFFKKTDDGKPIWHDAYQYSILDEEFAAIEGLNT
ncbi:GNAT family N-acetyltransferase [Gorillibacterium timonense]|uniref:GNAT family N-acetyltransferase n=1 Tax=Gorillibacterium timonense TaxID=1689269 RepID=UPI001F4894DE|nr:GNAT family protein [Gorillibacterium timonense]